MNRPSLLTRLLGRRFMALLVLPACVVAGVWCMAGDGSWWLGLFALVMALKTLSAIGQMRRYKAWAAQWQAMAEPIRMPHTGSSQQEADVDHIPSPRVRTARRGRLGVILAMVMLLGIPSYVASATDTVSSGLLCVWVAAGGYLVFRFLRRATRRNRESRQEARVPAAKQQPESPFVSLVMDRASSSPSRAEAMRALPDYCLRLLTR